MRELRYCESCGREMRRRIEPLKTFDTYTGNRHVLMYYRCPVKRWWILRHDDIIASIGEPEIPSETQG